MLNLGEIHLLHHKWESLSPHFISGSKFQVFLCLSSSIDRHRPKRAAHWIFLGIQKLHIFSLPVPKSLRTGARALDFSNSAQFKLNLEISTDGICSPDSDSGPAARVLILISHSPPLLRLL